MEKLNYDRPITAEDYNKLIDEIDRLENKINALAERTNDVVLTHMKFGGPLNE